MKRSTKIVIAAILFVFVLTAFSAASFIASSYNPHVELIAAAPTA